MKSVNWFFVWEEKTKSFLRELGIPQEVIEETITQVRIDLKGDYDAEQDYLPNLQCRDDQRS